MTAISLIAKEHFVVPSAPTPRLSASAALLLRCVSVILIGTFALCVQLAQAQLPTTIGWTALPATTSLEGSGACPPDYFDGDSYPFSANCLNVIRAWSGGIADTDANRLLIWGGGHTNYYGNEIYSLNLTTNPITLTRVKDPTVPTNYADSANCIEGIPPGSPDFAPNSRESYGGLAFIPGPYRMFVEGGSLACAQGDQSQGTWTVSLNNLSNASSWVHENPTLVGPLPGSSGGFTYGNVADYDPNSGLVFVSDSGAIYSYNYYNNAYLRITPSQGFVTSIYLGGAIDPTRKLFVLVGNCPGGTCGPGSGVFVADISNPASTTQQNWTAGTMADPTCAEFLSGGVNPIGAGNPGITFDSVANNFVAWPNQGDSVYILTPDPTNQRLTCQKMTFPGGPPNSSHANNQPNTTYGTYGRLRYFPALDAFVLVNDWNIPAYILRLRAPTGFTLSATPSTVSVSPGGTATYTVNVGALNGFTGTVSLKATGLPAGASSSFVPTSITSSGNSTLTITTAASTPTGSQTLTITGTSGSLTHSAMLTLTIAVAAPVITSATTASGTVGSTFSYQITATNAPTSYGATGLPAGLSVSSTTGLISGTPTAAGTSTVTLSATN